MNDLCKAAKDLLHEFDFGIFDDDLIRAVNALRAALAAAMEASTAPSAVAVDASTEPVMQPVIRARGKVPR